MGKYHAMPFHTLRGKQIVIIGGTSGLGLATARMALEAGAHVYLGGRSPARLMAALATLGRGTRGETIDVASEASVNAFFAPLDGIDHVAITAAQIAPAPLLHGDMAALRVNMASRFWGAVYALRAAVPKMAAEGSLVLTSGMITRRPSPGKSIAAAAASAVETLAHSLVGELAPRRINVISPGPMDTPLLAQATGGDPEALRAIAARLPLRRLGQPESYARSALFAMANPDLNGEVLHLDGGAAWG
ncbi:SDR family oxidoreductase [Edwardsiella piscicida]|uniref:SDR family oxidoreductase n=1 Tax=Edwardsiella piscicida TaxID=1263550 RepID=UPI00370D59AE